jgi:hypothetical protein
LSTLTYNNSQEDVLPLALVIIDCCLTTYEKEQLHEIPLPKPLTNILIAVKDLNLVIVKIDDIQELVERGKVKKF